MAETYWDLFWGYSAFWLIVSVYIFRIVAKQSELARRLLHLESKAEKHNE